MEYIKQYDCTNSAIREIFENSCHFHSSLPGIAVPFISYNLHSDLQGEIITKKLIDHENPLFLSLIRENPQDFVDKFNHKVTLLHQADVCHADLHLGNVVLSYEEREDYEHGELDLYFIDFDFSFYISSGNENEVIQKRMRDHFDTDDYDWYVDHDFTNAIEELDDLL